MSKRPRLETKTEVLKSDYPYSGYVRQTGRILQQPRARSIVPIAKSLWQNVETFLPKTAEGDCSEITQEGRRCQRAMTYHTVANPTKSVSCSAYCINHCAAWMPYLFKDLPNVITMKLPKSTNQPSFANCDGDNPIKNNYVDVNPYVGYHKRTMTEIQIAVGICPNQLSLVVYTLRKPFENKKPTVWRDEWYVGKIGGAKNMDRKDYNMLATDLCSTVVKLQTENVNRKVYIACIIGYHKDRDLDDINYYGPCELYFDLPGKTWFRPPSKWFSTGRGSVRTSLLL